MDRTKNLIHVAQIVSQGAPKYVYLRQVEPRQFVWFEQGEGIEEQRTEMSSDNIEEAIRLARRHWKHQTFQTMNCGFRYTLPERDEHGLNALFWQMKASYSSPTGIYFDDEIGCNCIVQYAPSESRNFWKNMQDETAKRI